ncbi:MAG: hypothetical protein J7J91_11890 [Deltaproteobacteria bacterium]|nr:hypothetical protein [Deltaproteobacteria bacterium]
MRKVRDILMSANRRDMEDMERALQEAKVVAQIKADYVRDLARVCVETASAIISALRNNDVEVAGRMCDILLRDAEDTVAKARELRDDLGEIERFRRGY